MTHPFGNMSSHLYGDRSDTFLLINRPFTWMEIDLQFLRTAYSIVFGT